MTPAMGPENGNTTMKTIRPCSRRTCASPHHASSGFTRTDAITCVAVVAMAALLLIPALANTSGTSHASVCRVNLGQLLTAWTQFANDNQGNLPAAADGTGAGWIQGWLDYSSRSDNTNTLFLTEGRYAQLGPYVAQARVFKCPSDQSTVAIPQQDGPSRPVRRVRSYSANGAMAPLNGNSWLGTGYLTYRKLHDIVAPPPSMAWVFIDEHPDSINDGFFAVQMPVSPASTVMVDYPAGFHDRSGVLSFADGHVESHPWTDPRTAPPVRNSYLSLGTPQSNNADILWLAARTSSR